MDLYFVFLNFAFQMHRMKYVGKRQVMNVKKFLRGSGETLEILAKSAVFAPVSSSGCDFLS